jgi:hypothetical protein
LTFDMKFETSTVVDYKLDEICYRLCVSGVVCVSFFIDLNQTWLVKCFCVVC